MTKQEILRNELEVFFCDLGFSVCLLEESTDEYPLFQIGPLETARFLNDDGKFFLALVNKVEDKFHPYREEIIFYYNETNEVGKKLIPLEIRIHKYPETQHVYVHDIPEKNRKKGQIIFYRSCPKGGCTFECEDLQFNSEIPELQAWMEQQIVG